MPDDATLAKLLSDALTHVESLKSQLAAADARAAHFERLAHQNETRLRDAADVWSTLERTMLHARTELVRILPSASSSSSLEPPRPAPAPTPRAAVVLPTAKTLSFPSLPPPPMHNPQRSVPAVATLAPATAPRSSPQPTTTSTTTTVPAAAPSPANSTGQKRKRADSTDLDDELAAAVDGVSDSASEMSIDDMILAVSGPSPATEHPPTTATTTAPAAAAVPPPRKKPSPPATTTTTATGPAVVHASHNALGQRQCRACGQAGRYKDGKCVEKWGPGPAGPGTVCDRCRKKMKRVERRADITQQQQQQQQQQSAAPSPAPAPAAPSAPSTAAPSPHMRPSTASSSTLSTLSPLAEPERERERVVLPPAKSLGLVGLGLLSSPEPIPSAPVVPQSRPFYDAAREVTSSSSSSASSAASHFGSSRRTSPAPSFAALAGLSGGGGGRFAYEPPTSSVRSYPVSAHRHWRDEVEPVS